jgi:serine/threonine protein kinase
MNYDKIGDFKFNVLGTLGRGSFGDVKRISKDGKEYALKVIENGGKEGIKSLRELDIMSRIIHPNVMRAELIVSEYLADKDVSRLGILMEKADMDLNRGMHDVNLKMNDRFHILHQVTLGVKALHDSGYLHLDLKPLNVLLFNKTARITDFGLSLLTENKNNERSKYFPLSLETVDHRSLDIINGSRNYSSADDVWSLGIIFLEVLSGGKSLFSRFSSKDFTDAKVKIAYEDKLSHKNIDNTLETFIKDKTAKKAIPFIKKMLLFDKDKRSTISEILKLFKYEITKTEYKNPQVEKTNCDINAYEGYDMLFRMSTQLSIRTETFFLAADIYQRSLSYRNISSDSKENFRNVTYNATLALYMAIKMVESYFADTVMLTELAGNVFKPYKLIIGESVLTNNWKGILYPNNLFRASTTERRLLQALDLTRNCFIYRNIDLQKWRQYSEEEEKNEGKFNKYISFSKFVGKTQYYRDLLEKENYLKNFYDEDQKI